MITFPQLTAVQIFPFFKGHTIHLSYKKIIAPFSIWQVLQTEKNSEKPQIFKCYIFVLFRIFDSFFFSLVFIK